MIISKTPFRISFAGGGTDLKECYRHGGGAVTSTAINKYVYITVNKRFDETIRVSYSKTEIVENSNEIQHPIVREALKLAGIKGGIEITSIADFPSGTGMGSSSSFTVGLLNALHAYKGEFKSAEALARDACKIEIDLVGEPIGKQDQYITAYGGLQHIRFNDDESVYVDPIICTPDIKKALNENLLLFYTGIRRKASAILENQKKSTKNKLDILKKKIELAQKIVECINDGRLLDRIGEILHEDWQLKKKLEDGITNPEINEYYQKALDAGALGGKILGAGGGGFLLVYCEKQNQKKVRSALKTLREVPFSFEPQGSKIIYIGGEEHG